MATAESCTGWCCVDCLMLLANGETPTGMTEDQAAAWQADINRRNEGYDITLGMSARDHDDDCPNHDKWAGAECFCEEQSFSWRPCDVCGKGLGGARYAVTFWKVGE